MSDLAVVLFKSLARAFFDANGRAIEHELRDKRLTQDDPFDEQVAELVKAELRAELQLARAPGPLITPDFVIYDPKKCAELPRSDIRGDPSAAVGFEVKKLDCTDGKVGRATGLDYNSTPPCGTVRVFDKDQRDLLVRGYYLFACLNRIQSSRYEVSSLVLCDGNFLNEDLELYLTVVGKRQKEIALGSYADGMNRVRPMMVFPNPLAMAEMKDAATLIHSNRDVGDDLVRVGTITRKTPSGDVRTFNCFRVPYGVREASEFQIDDPFPAPEGRTTTTQTRGRFVIPVATRD